MFGDCAEVGRVGTEFVPGLLNGPVILSKVCGGHTVCVRTAMFLEVVSNI